MRESGTNPSSSTISTLRRDSCRCRFSRRLSSLASINSCTKAAAVVNSSDIPRWQAARPSPEGHVGIAGAAVAYGDDVLPVLDVFAAGQLHHQLFVYPGDCREVEDVQDLHGRETGGPDPPLHHALAAVDELQFGEPEQVLRVVHSLGGAPGSHLPVLSQEAGQLQLLQVVFQKQRGLTAHAALPGGGGAHPHPRHVGIQLQVQPGRPAFQPAQHQVPHRVEADRPQSAGVLDGG